MFFIFSGLFKWLGTPIDLTILTAFLLILTTPISLPGPWHKDHIYACILFLGFFSIVTSSLIYTDSESYAKIKYASFVTGAIAYLYPILFYRIFSSFKAIRTSSLIVLVTFFVLSEFANAGILPIPIYIENYPNYLSIGTLTGTILILSTSYKNPILRLLIALTCIIILSTLGGRGPLLFSIPVWVYCEWRLSKRNIALKTLFLGFTSIISFAIIAQTGIASSTINRFSKIFQSEFSADSGRLNHYQVAIDIIEKRPLQGVGIGGFAIERYGYDTNVYPHNILCEVASEYGIPCLILFMMVLAFQFWLGLKCLKSNQRHLTLLAVFIFMFLNFQKSGGLESIRLLLAWSGLMSALHLNYLFNNGWNNRLQSWKSWLNLQHVKRDWS